MFFLTAFVLQPDLEKHSRPFFSCDAKLAALFTPPRPQLGRYEACTSERPIEQVAAPGWAIELVHPIDALGTAGGYDRSRAARLYGGRRARLARGWRTAEGGIEAVTLISPYPDASLAALHEGTLVIRYFVPNQP